MHIEIEEMKSGKTGQQKTHYNWRFRNKGKVTAFNDPAPTKAGAIARAKGVVTATIKCLRPRPSLDKVAPFFSKPVWDTSHACWVITWE